MPAAPLNVFLPADWLPTCIWLGSRISNYVNFLNSSESWFLNTMSSAAVFIKFDGSPFSTNRISPYVIRSPFHVLKSTKLLLIILQVGRRLLALLFNSSLSVWPVFKVCTSFKESWSPCIIFSHDAHFLSVGITVDCSVGELLILFWGTLPSMPYKAADLFPIIQDGFGLTIRSCSCASESGDATGCLGRDDVVFTLCLYIVIPKKQRKPVDCVEVSVDE